ncbi:MAG: hypothetical protein IPQ09_08585 [Myxococcales bacterium]|nr:hypothetical protein [Myxococcales bacterium]
MGGADEHVFHVLDLESGVAFAFVGACIPGSGGGRGRTFRAGPAARWVREIASRSGWALAAWVVLSAGSISSTFLGRPSERASRLVPADLLGLPLAAQDRMRNGESDAAISRAGEGAWFPGRAALVWAGALAHLVVRRPTYALFTVVQIATLLVDDVPTPRKRRLFAFAVGAALGAATQLLYLAVLGDLVVFFRTYLVDVPLMYRFIWPRTPYEILGLDGFSTRRGGGRHERGDGVSLIATGTLPRRARHRARPPLVASRANARAAQRVPYHFHPVSAG